MLFFKKHKKKEIVIENKDTDEAERERKLKMLCAMAVLDQFKRF